MRVTSADRTAARRCRPTPRIYWDFAATDTGDIDKTYANGVSFAKNDGYGISLTFDWDIGEDMTLRSITGYREIDWKVGIDLDGTPESIQEVTDHQEQDQFSQEFQLLGKMLDDRLNYVLGLYYFTEDGFVHDFVPFEGLLYVYDYQNDVDTESYAAFLHADFEVTDRFTLIAGGRYTEEDKSFIGGQADLNGFDYKISGCYPTRTLRPPAFRPAIPVRRLTCQQVARLPGAGPAAAVLPRGQAETGLQRLHPDVRLAVRLHRRRDGVRKVVEGLQVRRLDDATLGPDPGRRRSPSSNPSSRRRARSVSRPQLLDNHLLINTAIFYTDYKDIQLNFQEAASPVLRNARNGHAAGRRDRSPGASSPAASASPSRPATSMPSTTRSIRW